MGPGGIHMNGGMKPGGGGRLGMLGTVGTLGMLGMFGIMPGGNIPLWKKGGGTGALFGSGGNGGGTVGDLDEG